MIILDKNGFESYEGRAMTETLESQETPVFSYTLASADLRYIEIGERDIYLRHDQEKGPIFRGEIAGCGPGCDINLAEVLLEYAMSCEGCSRAELATEMLTSFGDHLGQVYVEKIIPGKSSTDTHQDLSAAIVCILNSMDSKFNQEITHSSLSYSLECCPLSECARDTGLNRSVEMAYLVLITLLRSLVDRIAPGWTIVQPSSIEINIPLHQVQLTS